MDGLEFENHIVHNILNDIYIKINQEDSKEAIDLDNLNFLNTSIEYIQNRLKITIVNLLNPAQLTNISNDLTNAQTNINNYINTKNEAYLNSAQTHLYNSFARFNSIPTHVTKSSYNFSRSISSFEKLFTEKNEQLNKEYDELLAVTANLKEQTEEQSDEIDRLKELLEEKELTIESLNKSFKTEFEEIVENIKEQSSEITNENESKIDNKITQIDNIFESKLVEHKESISELINKTDVSAQKFIEQLEEYRVQGRTLIGLINDSAVTGNYQKIANENKTTANIWRRISIGFMSLLSGLLIYAIWDISGSDFDWKKSIIRIIVAAALSYPATYAARESSKHRIIENKNRKLELELASINPFIDDLEPDEKKKIKEELVNKYFGNNLSESIDFSKEEEISVTIIEKILKSLLPFVK